MGGAPSCLSPARGEEWLNDEVEEERSCTHLDSSVSSFMLSFGVWGGSREEVEAVSNYPSAQKYVVPFERSLLCD